MALVDEKSLEEIYTLYTQGEYGEVINRLNKVDQTETKDEKMKGLVNYWLAISNAKMNEFNQAIRHFQQAIANSYVPDDLYYEFGQVLYVADKLPQARIAFKNSVAKNYKVAVSLYYMGFISEKLKDLKKAVSYYKMIEKTEDPEKKDVIQASKMQVGDIYLAQVEKQSDSFHGIEKYVLPEYQSALSANPNSSLASEIKTKIEKLQRKYDLVLFRMRNGRATQRPPYFLKVSAGVSQDSNVNNVADISGNEAVNEESIISNYGFFGRYSFYPNNFYSVATELSGNFNRYHSDNKEVTANDNYNLTAGLKINFEHSYKDRPATTYLEYEYGFNANDINQDDKLEKFNTSHLFGISEEIPFSENNPTVFRYRYIAIKGIDDIYSYNTNSFIWEQLYGLGGVNLYSYLGYDFNKFASNELFDNTALTARLDIILPTFINLFNPNLFVSYTNTQYDNDSLRDATTAVTPGVSINRPFGKHFYGTLTYSQTNQSGTLEADTFDKQVISFNLDYIY